MKSFHSSKLLTRQAPALKMNSLLWENLKKGTCLALGAFVLSGVKLFSQPLPLAACLVAALPMGLQPLLTAFGAILGYFLRCEASFAAEYTAVTLLMLAAVSVFQGTRLPHLRWFMPSMAASVSAVLGGISIFGGSAQISFLMVKVLLSALATAYFKKLMVQRHKNFIVICAMLASGLSGIMTFDLGFLAACAVCYASGDLAIATGMGIALELSGSYPSCVMVALIAPALLRQGLPKKDVLLSSTMYLLLPGVVFFCFGALNFGIFAANFAGVVGGMLFRRFLPSFFCGQAGENAGQTLEQAAQVMELTCRQLPKEVFSASNDEAEEVYDAAAERVCRCCPRFHRCWDHNAAQTYEALCAASHRIIERGVAQSEDFSVAFRENCCHLEGFVLAVNQELEGMLYRRRYRMQLKESRQVLAQELTYLAQYLRAAQNLPERQVTAFRPQVGVCTMQKKGERVSGDRGVCFLGGNGDFFVLLCDGMGTGEEAAEGSTQTVRFLQKLLKSGLAPTAALKILNGTEILRGGGRYTTIDLLHADLSHGMATLYKWGAAPSYLRHFDEIKTLGTAAPPPGVSMSQEPEEYSVCLKREEMLVLVSDGADGELVQELLSAYHGSSPRELAALLAGSAQEDDMTAVVVSLQLAS